MVFQLCAVNEDQHDNHASVIFLRSMLVSAPGQAFRALSGEWEEGSRSSFFHPAISCICCFYHPGSVTDGSFLSSFLFIVFGLVGLGACGGGGCCFLVLGFFFNYFDVVVFKAAFSISIYTTFILNLARKVVLFLQDPKYQVLDCSYSSSTSLLYWNSVKERLL